MKTLVNSKNNVLYKLLLAVAAVAGAVLLPQVLHLFGRVLGVNSALGEAVLPMHFPVLLAAYFCGPVVGVVVGAVSPILSYAISGMPSAMMLPFITVELIVYGFVFGMLGKKELPCILSLLIAQIAGRVFRAVAVVISVYALGSSAVILSSVWRSILIGLPGIAIQLLLIPSVADVMRKSDVK